MSETTAQYLARLHLAIGLSVDTSIIDRRAEAIDRACKEATLDHVALAGSVAAGVIADVAKIQWLVRPISDADPSFNPVQVDKATAIACSAATNAFLADDDNGTLAAALTVLCAGVGRMQNHMDERLGGIAQSRLWDLQRTPMPEAKYVTPKTQVSAEQLKQLGDLLAAGNVTGAAAPQQAILQGLIETVMAQSSAAETAFKSLANRQTMVEEEVRMQWWVVGAASEELSRPFASMAAFEAAARAARELATMISPLRQAGPFAAPALLERALRTPDETRNDCKQFAEAIVAVPLVERRRVFEEKPSAQSAPSVFPIMLAAEYSIESEDEEDWKPRFKRITHVDPEMEITPVEFAEQLYREHLLWKLLVG